VLRVYQVGWKYAHEHHIHLFTAALYHLNVELLTDKVHAFAIFVHEHVVSAVLAVELNKSLARRLTL
jgi:hypothetical protein